MDFGIIPIRLKLFEGFFTKNMKLEFEYPIKYLKMGFGIIPFQLSN